MDEARCSRHKHSPVAYVGKGSPNSGTPWYENDYNNFGPAVGFAWQVAVVWQGKTTIRGGYQVTYQIGQSGNNLFQEQCRSRQHRTTSRIAGDSINRISRSDEGVVPDSGAINVTPMQPVPTTARTQQVYNPEKGIVTPYTQNLTLSITRSLRSNLTIDLRYVGTLSRKQWNPVFNINIPNFLYNGSEGRLRCGTSRR